MGQYNLNRLFKPRHVAVVGASEKPGSMGNALMTNLMAGGYAGTLLPVNARYRTIHGHPAVGSVLDLEPGVDLAIIATPIHTVPDIVQGCVQKKIGAAVIISAGGKEIGAQGRQIEEQITRIAYEGGLRIVGPNCMGIISSGVRLNASFAAEMPVAGKLAFVSQSGAICGAILDMAFKENIGFSHFVSIGSMVDVDFGDMIDYLGNDTSAESILLYIESLTHFRKFMSAARSVSRIKPIIVLKAGRSPAGARAAASHTGALAGEDSVYDAAFKRAGIVRADTIEELFDCAELMAKQPRPRGSRLAIVTNGGGPGVMATDALARYGLEPAALDAETLKQLDTILPPFWSRNNPIDMIGDASVERIRGTLRICLDAPTIDGLLFIFVPQALTDPLLVAEELTKAVSTRRTPVFTCWLGGKHIEKAVAFLNENGIPTYDTPERAIRAFMFMVEYAANIEMLQEIPPRLTRNMAFDFEAAENVFSTAAPDGFLSESDTWQILTAYGLPLMQRETAATAEDAARIGQAMGYPLVMKLLSPDISHKTDVGGVCLDLRSKRDVRSAFRRIMDSAHTIRPDARIMGVTLQPLLSHPDYEILLGAKRDTHFGPVILFGMGGIYTEILKDRSIGLPPMNRLLARRLMQHTKVWSLLQGYRNRPAADVDRLEELIIRLSQLLIDFPQIAELDMNPVLIQNGNPVIVDARIRVSPSDTPSPMHLVIAPYPDADEAFITTEDGTHLLIRPVKPEDAPLFTELFQKLPSDSIRSRFYGAADVLTPAVSARFTQIDYDREIAMVAFDQDSASENILGVVRIMGDPDGKIGRFAVLVGDRWHGRGVGSNLVKTCMLIAKKRGFQTITGVVRKENISLLAMGKQLGFDINKMPDTDEYELVIRA
jgi:acetyltransferase